VNYFYRRVPNQYLARYWFAVRDGKNSSPVKKFIKGETHSLSAGFEREREGSLLTIKQMTEGLLVQRLFR